jgi:hypothetical protein
VAYLPASLFSTYTYSKPASLPSNDAPTGDDEGFSIDLRLDTLIQCLEIFGGIATGSEHKRSFRPDGDSDAEDSRAPMRENRKPVSLKMTFVELGGPLTIMCACLIHLSFSWRQTRWQPGGIGSPHPLRTAYVRAG